MKKLIAALLGIFLIGALSEVASAQQVGTISTGYILGDSRNQANCINGATDFTTYLKARLPANWQNMTIVNQAVCGQNLETTDHNYQPTAFLPPANSAVFLLMSSVNSALGAPSGPGAPAVTPGGDSAATMYGYIKSIATKALNSGQIFVLGIEPPVGSLSTTQLAQYQQLQQMILQGPVFWQYLVRLDEVFATNVDPIDYFDATHTYTPTGAFKIAQQIGLTINGQAVYQAPYQCPNDQCQLTLPPPSGNCSPGVVYSATLTGDSGSESNNSFRSLSTPTSGGSGCGHVTVEFVASAAGGAMAVNHASICVQGTGSGCASTPVPLLVDGSASFTVAQGATQTSDPAVFSFTTGQVLLVTTDYGTPVANARATASGPGFYYCVSCAMASQTNPSGGLSFTTGQGPIGFDKITALQ